MTEEKRKKRYAFRPITNFSSIAPFFCLTIRPQTTHYAWTYIFTIVKDFFSVQILHVLHIKRRPVINVDTEIDDKIPFKPKYVSTYMNFVKYFMRPLDMMRRRLGFKKASPYLCLYLKFLTNIYKNAASIYRFCLTTTSRPKYFKTRKFRAIHIFDKHLQCVPSIHVAIAAGTYAWFKQFYKTGIVSQQEADFHLKEIQTEATAIVESVLFIKQHSVNCVPLALYMLSSTMSKSFFSANDVSDFIEGLFVDNPYISDEVRSEIIDHFYYMYDRALLESKFSSDWQNCIRHWLTDYATQTGQKIPVSQ